MPDPTERETPLPCPFCGSPAELIERHPVLPNGSHDTVYTVVCTLRECQSSTVPWYPARAAIAAWNRRASAPAAASDTNRTALTRDLLDWLPTEPAQESLVSTSLADYLLSHGWSLRASAPVSRDAVCKAVSGADEWSTGLIGRGIGVTPEQYADAIWARLPVRATPSEAERIVEDAHVGLDTAGVPRADKGGALYSLQFRIGYLHGNVIQAERAAQAAPAPQEEGQPHA